MVWKNQQDGGQEIIKVYHLLARYTRGRVLDIGSGAAPVFLHWTRLDNGHDYKGVRVADLHLDGAAALPFVDGFWDAVVSSHFLEHVANWRAALAEWWRIVRPGGHLVLYLPHPAHYPKVGEPGANRDHRHNLTPEDIKFAVTWLTDDLQRHGAIMVENETRTDDDEYSFFQVYRKDTRLGTGFHEEIDRRQGAVLVARPGAIGDIMLSTAVLDGMKARYDRIDFLTTPLGGKLLQHDPRIDNLIVIDEDQVLVENWGEMVRRLGQDRYEHYVNLTHTIEGRLLFLPGTIEHTQSDIVRRAIADDSYIRYTAKLAGVPFESARIDFVPTLDESAFARNLVLSHPGPFIFWMMGGSAIHKEWPYIDEAFCDLFGRGFEGTIMAVGDASLTGTLGRIMSTMGGRGFKHQAETQVLGSTGELDIRAVIAIAQHSHLVVGPETGVLMAMAHEAVPKVVIMSHSAPHNLTAGWRRASSVIPATHTPCWPCHRLHNGDVNVERSWRFCHRGAVTQAALCQENTPVDAVIDAILGHLPSTAFRKEAS